jgi:hypothetical protein
MHSYATFVAATAAWPPCSRTTAISYVREVVSWDGFSFRGATPAEGSCRGPGDRTRAGAAPRRAVGSRGASNRRDAPAGSSRPISVGQLDLPAKGVGGAQGAGPFAYAKLVL